MELSYLEIERKLKNKISLYSKDDLYEIINNTISYFYKIIEPISDSELGKYYKLRWETLRKDWKQVWNNRLENQPAHILTWLKHPTRDVFWKHGSVCEDWSSIKCAVLAVGGWADSYTNAPPQIVENLDCPRSAWIGPWEHKYPNIASIEPRGDFFKETIDWFNCFLKKQYHSLPEEMLLVLEKLCSIAT